MPNTNQPGVSRSTPEHQATGLRHTPLLYKGRFSIWTYDPSHGQLLLRGVHGPPRRVDLLFVDVRLINLGTLLIDVTIDETDIGSSEIARSPNASEPGLRAFRITKIGRASCR